MLVTIKNVEVENVVKGKSRYSKATVEYEYRGEPRKQSVMSFSNPDVFKKVQEFIGQEVEVETTKNAAGYSEWASITATGGVTASTANQGANPAGAATGSAGTTKVTGSNYETRDERAARQVLIVKQSSLAQAVESLGPKQEVDAYIDRAQVFVDWVLEQNAPE